MASKDSVDPGKINDMDVAKFVRQNKLVYYNENIHRASFVLPNYIAQMIAEYSGT